MSVQSALNVKRNTVKQQVTSMLQAMIIQTPKDTQEPVLNAESAQRLLLTPVELLTVRIRRSARLAEQNTARLANIAGAASGHIQIRKAMPIPAQLKDAVSIQRLKSIHPVLKQLKHLPRHALYADMSLRQLKATSMI